MERNFLDHPYAVKHHFSVTEREYKALIEVLALAENRQRKYLREHGFTVKYLNSAINKIKNARAI